MMLPTCQLGPDGDLLSSGLSASTLGGRNVLELKCKGTIPKCLLTARHVPQLGPQVGQVKVEGFIEPGPWR